jgi:hypothetical protein
MNTRRTTLAKVASTLLAAAWVAGCGAPAVKGPDGGATGVPSGPPPAPPPVSSAPDPAAARPVEPVLGLAEQELVKGIRSYEDGDYKSAARQLQAALNFGLAGRAEQVKAHKYLAFINCVSSRIPACRDEFRRAFALDPQFELEPAEAGHPIWGPVFRSVKAEAAKAPRK